MRSWTCLMCVCVCVCVCVCECVHVLEERGREAAFVRLVVSIQVLVGQLRPELLLQYEQQCVSRVQKFSRMDKTATRVSFNNSCSRCLAMPQSFFKGQPKRWSQHDSLKPLVVSTYGPLRCKSVSVSPPPSLRCCARLFPWSGILKR